MRKIYMALAAAGLLLCSCSYIADFNYGAYPEINDGTEKEQEGGDKFEEFADNDFIETSDNNVSTFSVDADGASYAIMRKYVTEGMRPVKGSVRIEEFLNYFTFDYPEPEEGSAVGLNAEVAPCPWNEDKLLMRLGLKGRSLEDKDIPQANYVFLIDVSGSMNRPDKIELLKEGLSAMVDYLKPDDRISIITYSGNVKKVLESTPASKAKTIRSAIRKLAASGSTAGGEAMKMAYEEALANYIDGGNNRVIMGTDGDFNVGITSTEALVEMVEGYAAKGVYLTVCGFGSGNLNDAMMEKISNSGNGTYEYIDSEDELTKVFVNERSKFCSVANDTKVQLTFDSSQIKSYRLIGYENRVMSEEDFENDGKDAGEIGSGQTITALYELVPTKSYKKANACAMFDVRYKKSLGSSSVELSMPVTQTSDKLSENMSFAAGVASYGMLLRSSKYKGEASYTMARNLVKSGMSFDPFGYKAELLTLITKAQEIE
jgi:Ca-activated chloride channel family protein